MLIPTYSPVHRGRIIPPPPSTPAAPLPSLHLCFSGFKDDHLCWAKVRGGDAGMELFERILKLPVKTKEQPNDMSGLVEPLLYNISLLPA